jgi:hypothetical protein
MHSKCKDSSKISSGNGRRVHSKGKAPGTSGVTAERKRQTNASYILGSLGRAGGRPARKFYPDEGALPHKTR